MTSSQQVRNRRRSWGGATAFSKSKSPSAFKSAATPMSGKKALGKKDNKFHMSAGKSSGSSRPRRHLSFDQPLQQLSASAGEFSRSERRKSWTKSGVVEKIEEMQRRRAQRRMSNQIELEQKKAQLESYGEWGMFAKLMEDTRKDLAANVKVGQRRHKYHHLPGLFTFLRLQRRDVSSWITTPVPLSSFVPLFV